MSEEGFPQPETNIDAQPQPQMKRKKRPLFSLSLQRASYYPDTSPYSFDHPGSPPPPPLDDTPTLSMRPSPKRRMLLISAWIASVALVGIIVFVATNAGWFGRGNGKGSISQTATAGIPQRTTATGMPIQASSLGTSVSGIPTATGTAGDKTPPPLPTNPATRQTVSNTATPFPTIQPSPNDRWENINVVNAPSVNGYQFSVVVQADTDDCYKAPGQTYCGDYRSQVVIFIPNAASNHGAVHVTHYVSNCANGCPVVAAPITSWDISQFPYPSNHIDAFVNPGALYFYQCVYADAVFTQSGQNIARATTSWQCL